MKKLFLSLLFIYIINISNAQWKHTSLNKGRVTCIAFSANNIFAGTEMGGLFLASKNDTNWTSINTGLAKNISILSLAISGKNIFAGTSDGVYLSTNYGSSWDSVNTGLTNRNIFSLVISGSNIFAGTMGGVFLSTNNGKSWTSVSTGLTNRELYVFSLAISGTNIFAGTLGKGVYLSKNMGTSWNAVNTGLPIGISITSFAIKEKNIFVGSDALVFLSSNNGASWSKMNNGFLNNTTQINNIAISGNNIFAGTGGDGVYLSINNGNNWSQVNTGIPTGYCIYSLAINDSNIYAGTSDRIYFSAINDIKTIQLKNNISNKIETIKLPPNSGFDIEANEGCFKINKVTGGQVSIIEGNIKQQGNIGPYNLNFGYTPICCPITLDCYTKYTFKNYGNYTAVVELEKIEK